MNVNLLSFYVGFVKTAEEQVLSKLELLQKLISTNSNGNILINGYTKYSPFALPELPGDQKNTLSIKMHGNAENGKKVYGADPSLLKSFKPTPPNYLFSIDEVAHALGNLTNNFHNVRDASCSAGGPLDINTAYKHLAPNATNIVCNLNGISYMPVTHEWVSEVTPLSGKSKIYSYFQPPPAAIASGKWKFTEIPYDQRKTNISNSSYNQYLKQPDGKFKDNGKTTF